jgi:hypothetical protein
MGRYHFVLDLVVYHHNIDNKQVQVDYLFLHIPHSDIVHPNILKFINTIFSIQSSNLFFYLVMLFDTYYHQNPMHKYIYNLLNLLERMLHHFDMNYFYKDQQYLNIYIHQIYFSIRFI